jgi:hypothetical protein
MFSTWKSIPSISYRGLRALERRVRFLAPSAATHMETVSAHKDGTNT